MRSFDGLRGLHRVPWVREDAPDPHDDVASCVHASNLLGSDPSVVLHGGGNTSVKQVIAVNGINTEIVHVKISGHDLATIQRDGFAPLRRSALLALVALDTLDDRDMVAAFRAASMDSTCATASIEAILHALLPHRFVLHSHADAVVTLTDSPLTDDDMRAVFGESVVVLAYVRPGFDLAKLLAATLSEHPADAPPMTGLILRNHGLFTFDDDAERAYNTHLDLIDRAQQRIESARTLNPPAPTSVRLAPLADGDLAEYTALRDQLCSTAGFAMIMNRDTDDLVEGFLSQHYLVDATSHGNATMEHVIHVKPFPLVGTDIVAFAHRYRDRFSRLAGDTLRSLDPAPRVILDRRWGLLTAGRTPKEVERVRDIYRHTIKVVMDAECLGGFRSLTERELFDIEYWELEQMKLQSAESSPPLTGMVAILVRADHRAPDAWLNLAVGDCLARLGAITVPAKHDDLDHATRVAITEYGGVDLVASVGNQRASTHQFGRPILISADGSVITVAAGEPPAVVASGRLLDAQGLELLCEAVARAAFTSELAAVPPR